MPKKRNVKREDGRIAVQVYLGHVDGKRRYKTVYGRTQKETDKKAEQVKIEIGRGIDVTADQDTFSKWADSFLKQKATDVSEGQYRNCIGVVDFWKKQIKKMLIKNIRVQTLQDIINDLARENPNTGRPTAKQTLKFYLSVARQIIHLAIKNKVVLYNPADDVTLPANAPVAHRRALTGEEQRWIIDTPHRAQRAAMIMMYAGLRRGELMALTWDDVDLKNKTIRVNKAVAIKDGKLKIKPFTKTGAGMRTVDIPQRLTDFLAEEKKKVPKDTINYLVCRSASGALMTDTAWRRMWKSYLTDLNVKYGFQGRVKKLAANKKIGKDKKQGRLPLLIPNITPHWLRHTFATLLYLAGVDVLTARDQLGHADIKTTLAIYTHLDKIYKRKSMAKLDNYLDPREESSEECKSDASQENLAASMNAGKIAK